MQLACYFAFCFATYLGPGPLFLYDFHRKYRSTSEENDLIAMANHGTGHAQGSESQSALIWSHYGKQLDAIDDLEKRLNEKSCRVRRRVSNLLDQVPTHRRSHLRVFVTHKYDKVEEAPQKNGSRKWTMVIEGKLLVGLLDHKSAARVEQEGAHAAMGQSRTSVANAAASSLTVGTRNAPIVNVEGSGVDVSGVPAASSLGRSADRRSGGGEKEEDEPPAVIFTHLFDKLTVQFTTIYQPKNPPSAKSSTPKKSRSTKRKSPVPQSEVAIHPRFLTRSKSTKVVWTKDATPDANAFFVSYCHDNEADPPPPNTKLHSVVASISLVASRTEDMYKPCSLLADNFFPKHGDDVSRRRATGKKRKTDGGAAATPENEDDTPIALDNDIYVPSLLTMNEITMALFQYIQDKNLLDPSDKSLVRCDKVLAGIFDCETFNFSELRGLLLSRNLVTKIDSSDDPIALTYIMKEGNVSPQDPTDPLRGPKEDDDTHHQVLSFDMDVWVPGLFHYRTRELMRRIKKREFEFTSSRTKGRYLLVARRGNEDLVKNKIELAVSGRGYSARNIPVFLALARAAPPASEARKSGQTDSKLCSLVQRLEEHTNGAEAGWSLVDACRRLGKNEF